MTLDALLLGLLAWTALALVAAGLYALAGYRWRTPAATTHGTVTVARGH